MPNYSFYGEVTVDASLETCASWILNVNSRERTKFFRTHLGGVKLECRTVNDHCLIVHSISNLAGFSKRRELSNVLIWEKDKDGSLLIASEPTTKSLFTVKDDTAAGSSRVLESQYCLTKLTRAESKKGFEQTSIMLAGEQFYGTLNLSQIEALAKKTLIQLSSLRKAFDKSLAMGKLSRKEFIDAAEKNEEVYSENEEKSLFSGATVIQYYESSSDIRQVSRSLLLPQSFLRTEGALTFFLTPWNMINCR